MNSQIIIKTNVISAVLSSIFPICSLFLQFYKDEVLQGIFREQND